jgi:hypothetical protein
MDGQKSAGTEDVVFHGVRQGETRRWTHAEYRRAMLMAVLRHPVLFARLLWANRRQDVPFRALVRSHECAMRARRDWARLERERAA